MHGFQFGRNGEASLHLQFADDTVFLFSDQEVDLGRIHRCFELVSGLKISFDKSELVGVGCSEEEILPLADSLSCKVDKLPIQYFDLPIGANPRLKGIWDPMVENFDRKLSLWKKRYLSMGGRVTLIKVMSLTC